MKIKVYKVWVKDYPDNWYLVDAPSKRVAKWCGANLHNNTYMPANKVAKDVIAKRDKSQEN
jgi:hypothetical protein